MSDKETHLPHVNTMPPLPISQGWMGWNRTGEWRYFDPIHENHLAPCDHACPVGEDIQKAIALLAHRKFREAYDVIRESNPLPSVCGRVCNHPCETQCNRSDLDDVVSIRCLERFIGDWGLKNVKTQAAVIDSDKGEIAVIGSGPAGLSAAWHLTNLQYKVTVFEASAKVGGMLRAGIPEFRLPRKILDAEIHSLVDRGIEFRLNVRVGQDIPIDDLRRFRAILIATGAHKPRVFDIPGSDLPGVQQGLDFLSEVNCGKRDLIEGDVAIVGGNNTAMLCARAALRLGGRPTIYFRRSANEAPALIDQIEEARQEGIEITYLTAPTTIRKTGNELKLTLQRLTLGKKDSSGKRIAVSIHGAHTEVTVSRVIIALGEDPDLSFLPRRIDRESWGINTGGTHQTSVENIFAAGDCADNHRSVSSAIGAGRVAVQAIDRHLHGKKVFAESTNRIITRFADLNVAYFQRSQVTERKRIPDERRLTSFAEVNIGMAEADVLREAERCFSCGVCDSCDNCMTFCPDHAVTKQDGSYKINYDYCKGCGICIHECPRDAIHLRIRQVSR
jgi:2-oxoacid:acceptor oxidoreductase delta subunit (pyruvate/2-ketoisovalerate family)